MTQKLSLEDHAVIRDVLKKLDLIVAFFEAIDKYSAIPEFAKHKIQVASKQLNLISQLPREYREDNNVIFLEERHVEES